MTDTRPNLAPETFMGVPVPMAYRYHWDHVHAIHWRRGVRAAIEDIQKDIRTIDFTRRYRDETNPEETK